MTTRTTARPTTGAGPHPDRTNTMTDSDLHHLLNLADAGRVHHTTRHGYIDTMTGTSLDDLVYAADDLGMVHLDGQHVQATVKARRWQATTPRPDRAHPDALFRPAEAA